MHFARVRSVNGMFMRLINWFKFQFVAFVFNLNGSFAAIICHFLDLQVLLLFRIHFISNESITFFLLLPRKVSFCVSLIFVVHVQRVGKNPSTSILESGYPADQLATFSHVSKHNLIIARIEMETASIGSEFDTICTHGNFLFAPYENAHYTRNKSGDNGNCAHIHRQISLDSRTFVRRRAEMESRAAPIGNYRVTRYGPRICLQ